ncbi:MAG: heme-binding beta-barrel domain-containing protein [Kangiellaceae bacterium]|jgi:hypothetical protein|nr:heme-binding beta-barrel domain-containing protein [Kangiellaceae bacterium]
MSNYPNINYGPLTKLIGQWQGAKGVDISPEEDGPDTNEFYDNITFSPARDLDNADEQELVAVHYHQTVFRKRDNKMIHNQTGYYIWDEASQTIMHNFVIPRGIAVVALGSYREEGDALVMEFFAEQNDDYNNFSQSPFLKEKAETLSFKQKVIVSDKILRYSQTTLVDIYGNEFEHTDNSMLNRVD